MGEVEETKGEGEVAEALEERGRTHFLRAEYDKAIEFYHQGLIAREVGDWRGVTAAFAELALVYVTVGRQDRAKVYLDDALSLLAEHDDVGLRGKVALTEGAGAFAEGDLGAAERAYRRSRDACASSGRPREAAEASLGYAAVRLEGGDLEGLEDVLREAVRAAEQIASEDLRHGYLLASGRLALARGRAGDALSAFLKVQRFAESHDRPELIWRSYHSLGNTYRVQGNLREAARLYLEAMDVLRRTWERLPGEYREAYLQDRHRRALQSDIQDLKEALPPGS